MAEGNGSVTRRVKSCPTKHMDERPISFELETDFTNTETKLVVLDFLSSQPIERLTARNSKRVSFSTGEEAPSYSSKRGKFLGKSPSDGSSHEAYRERYAKLAKSGKTLRKQYSLRLKKDLDVYLQTRGKSMDDLSDSFRSGAINEGGDECLLQRSYTEGETYFRVRSRSPLRNQDDSRKATKPRRKISRELKEGITEFDPHTLRHVVRATEITNKDVKYVYFFIGLFIECLLD